MYWWDRNVVTDKFGLMSQKCCEDRNETDVEPELILLASVGNEQIQGLMELARYMHTMDIVDTDILKWIKVKIVCSWLAPTSGD